MRKDLDGTAVISVRGPELDKVAFDPIDQSFPKLGR
jgi:hypothetical protein